MDMPSRRGAFPDAAKAQPRSSAVCTCEGSGLRFFGSPDNVLAYAQTYTGITALGFPFLILTNGGGHLVRADGSPLNAMLYNLSGALINTVLDPLFIFVLGFGVQGAAIATVISQVLSALFVFVFLTTLFLAESIE